MLQYTGNYGNDADDVDDDDNEYDDDDDIAVEDNEKRSFRLCNQFIVPCTLTQEQRNWDKRRMTVQTVT